MTAKTADLDKQAGEKSTAQLTCRTFQHSWNVNRGEVDQEGRWLFWSTPCDRCETVKTTKVNRRTGLRESSTYAYAPDYQFHALGALSANERGSLRLLLLERIGAA